MLRLASANILPCLIHRMPSKYRVPRYPTPWSCETDFRKKLSAEPEQRTSQGHSSRADVDDNGAKDQYGEHYRYSLDEVPGKDRVHINVNRGKDEQNGEHYSRNEVPGKEDVHINVNGGRDEENGEHYPINEVFEEENDFT